MKSVQLVVVAAAAAAAKSLQWYPTLCDPIDSSPPGSPVPGILQERTLEWVAISFSMVVVSFIKIKYRGGKGRWAERIAFKHFFKILCLLLFFFPLAMLGLLHCCLGFSRAAVNSSLKLLLQLEHGSRIVYEYK